MKSQTRRLRVPDGYRPNEASIIVNQRLSRSRFRQILDLLGMPPERHKAWAPCYFFETEDPDRLARVLAYLRAEDLRHGIEMTFTADREDGQ